MARFSTNGLCLFGKHKGKHAKDLPLGWVAWAKENIRGFHDEYQAALSQRNPNPPKARSKPARIYILDYSKKYERRRPAEEDDRTDHEAP